MRKIILILLIVIATVSCHTSKKAAEATTSVSTENKSFKKLQGAWELQMIFASDNTWSKTPYLDFNINENVVAGFSGCNAIRGKFTTGTDNFIAFDKNFISTKMACADPAVNKAERNFLAVLQKVNKFTTVGDEMELSQGEIVLMKFKRKVN